LWFIEFKSISSEELVLLGETQEYEPLSRAAYYKAIKEGKIKKAEQNNNGK